jgi:hypothetical protein
MPLRLSCVRLPKADYADTILEKQIAENMQPAPEIAYRYVSPFPFANLYADIRRTKIELHRPLKG